MTTVTLWEFLLAGLFLVSVGLLYLKDREIAQLKARVQRQAEITDAITSDLAAARNENTKIAEAYEMLRQVTGFKTDPRWPLVRYIRAAIIVTVSETELEQIANAEQCQQFCALKTEAAVEATKDWCYKVMTPELVSLAVDANRRVRVRA